MAQGQLILVEGLPGSGKSTTAQAAYEILSEQNREPRLFLEGDLAHPADYDSWSYFPKRRFDELPQQWLVFSGHAWHMSIRCSAGSKLLIF